MHTKKAFQALKVPNSETLKNLSILYLWMQKQTQVVEIFSPIHKKELLNARLLEYHSLNSTQTLMCEHAQTFFQSGDLVWAYQQTQGRGRGHHNWTSQSGYSLTFSYLLQRSKHRENFFYTQLAALALARALETLSHEGIKNHTDGNKKALQNPFIQKSPATPFHCVIKWPNDVLIHGKKVAGVLIDTVPVKENPEKVNLIIGVGLNALEPPEILTQYHQQFKDQDYTATSFYHETGYAVPLAQHLVAFLQDFFNLEALFLSQSRESLLTEWHNRNQLIGKTLQLNSSHIPHSKFWGTWQIQKVSISGMVTLAWIGNSYPSDKNSSFIEDSFSPVLQLTLEELGLSL